MELLNKTFPELTKRELYDILAARAAVFVVEQTCPYQDIDGQDELSRHVFLCEEGRLLAYLRLLPLGNGRVQIGRVLTLRRKEGLGAAVLTEGIRSAFGDMSAEEIYLEAQTYAVGFYEREGFRVISEEFLEDGIPHVKMTRGRAGKGVCQK